MGQLCHPKINNFSDGATMPYKDQRISPSGATMPSGIKHSFRQGNYATPRSIIFSAGATMPLQDQSSLPLGQLCHFKINHLLSAERTVPSQNHTISQSVELYIRCPASRENVIGSINLLHCPNPVFPPLTFLGASTWKISALIE